MKKMKREEIDRIILGSFQETGDNTLSKFLDNITIVKSALEKDGIGKGRDRDFAAQLISCIMTAQTSALCTMRNVLYKILCEDREETKHTTNGGNEHEIKP